MEKIPDHIVANRNLDSEPEKRTGRELPAPVVSRAKSAGAAGEAWLAGLDGLISELEEQWDVSVGEALSGGTHAFAANADGRHGEKYVLKIDMPEELGGDFANGMAALERAGGRGYARLYAYDLEKKACLLERLGTPVNRLGCSVTEQLRIICSALQEAWNVPAENTALPGGKESVAWFREFLGGAWEKLGRPCSRRVMEQAFSYLQAREQAMDPADFVLLHGDAHGGNTLKKLSGEGFKLIDPDGIVYERAYDLGVLMREWVEEYEPDPLKKGRERCGYLHRLTGVSEQAIWEWGYLQTVSTAFVLLQIGQEETGRKMLYAAECWAGGKEEAEGVYGQDDTDGLADFLQSEYGFHVRDLVPAKRGFYGVTWKAETESGTYFVKIDFWNRHKESYRSSLSAVQFMTENGISFLPKVRKTKDGRLYGDYRHGVAAVFEYVQGDLLEACSVELLFGRLARVYRLGTGGLALKAETFGTEPAGAFQTLKETPGLPAGIKLALEKKEPVTARYARRLEELSSVCRKDKGNFHITHGDAGGNCILNGNRLFLVDWDSVMLAPVERDAWPYLGDVRQLEQINSVLAENGIDYRLEQRRLCYYCYSYFFHYLNEYLKCLADAEREEQRTGIAKSLTGYLEDSWIYKRLDAADRMG